ncbi:MAG: ribosomal L7Ae/L30e/S12e/Gadd45 family protein [Clostridiaceae bacterium]
MVERLKELKVVGIKQSSKALKAGKSKKLFIAKDANENMVSELIELAIVNSVEIEYVSTMKELGKLCGIDVKAAAAVTVFN